MSPENEARVRHLKHTAEMGRQDRQEGRESLLPVLLAAEARGDANWYFSGWTTLDEMREYVLKATHRLGVEGVVKVMLRLGSDEARLREMAVGDRFFWDRLDKVPATRWLGLINALLRSGNG